MACGMVAAWVEGGWCVVGLIGVVGWVVWLLTVVIARVMSWTWSMVRSLLFVILEVGWMLAVAAIEFEGRLVVGFGIEINRAVVFSLIKVE